MDRFIAWVLYLIYRQLQNLKSNMDRFIANLQSHFLITLENLKSNMDRFIGVNEPTRSTCRFVI